MKPPEVLALPGMIAARRYSEMLRNVPATTFREDTAGGNELALTELEIQAHWFAGDFGTEFVSTRGEKIEVVQFGTWNREAGPDFIDAAISVNGGEPVRGSIELDPDAQDWERHGHSTNSDYEHVVLHVCLRQGTREFFTRTRRHKEVPRIKINAGNLTHTLPPPLAKAGRCSGPLRDLPPGKLQEVLEAAAQFRLSKKAARLARLAELHGPDEALYQSLAATLGYKNNKLPFTLLAQRLPLKFLQQRKRDLEAILFGTAGFLGEADFTKFDPETRTWLRGLWDRWWKLRGSFQRISLLPGAWRLGSVRPANHPQRRVAALVEIVRHFPKISALAAKGDPPEIGGFFANLRNEYWDSHYTLTSKKSAVHMALVGETRINDILANVFYPMLIASRPALWGSYAKLPAPLVSNRVKIAAARLLSDTGGQRTLLKSATNQQGLLQIYEDFCMHDNSDCAQCLFPTQIAQWR